MTDVVLTRAVRRETHSPRTVAAVIVLVVVAAAATYAAIEIVLELLGRAPLLVSPTQTLSRLPELPRIGSQPLVVAWAVAVALIGAILIVLGVAPGRRPKHQLGVSPHAVIVDNGVIASAVAEVARRELDLPKGGVVVGVGHRSADVTVRPEPGQRVDGSRVRDVVERELAGYELAPALRVRVRVVRSGAEGEVAA